MSQHAIDIKHTSTISIHPKLATKHEELNLISLHCQYCASRAELSCFDLTQSTQYSSCTESEALHHFLEADNLRGIHPTDLLVLCYFWLSTDYHLPHQWYHCCLLTTPLYRLIDANDNGEWAHQKSSKQETCSWYHTYPKRETLLLQ